MRLMIGLNTKDKSRSYDCSKLLSAISDESVESILERLDNGSKMLVSSETLEHGPFAAFRAGEPAFGQSERASAPVHPADSMRFESEAVDVGVFDCVDSSEEMAAMSPWLQSIFEDNVLQATHEPLDYPTGAPFSATLLASNAFDPSVVDQISDVLVPPLGQIAIPVGIFSFAADLSLSVYPRLLQHYNSFLIKVLSYSQLEAESPWKVVFLPSVLQTFSETTLFGESNNHAKTSLLFSTLSTSAYNMENLGVSLPGSNRSTLGETLYERAKHHTQKCLWEPRAGSKKARYKEILMALMGAITTCIVSGNTQDARAYLLEAEKFIHLYGFDKRHKSQKIRTLHSIYVYRRILGETTSQCSHELSEDLRDHVDSPESTDSGNCASFRFPSAWNNRSVAIDPQNSDQDEVLFETQIVGPIGAMTDPSIMERTYQIPETMLQMISHTTQLANDMQLRLRNFEAYQGRVKLLENRICSYKNPTQFLSDATQCTDRPLFTTMSFLLTNAVHSAIMIYFYQRVRDLNLIVLQQYAVSIIRDLLEIERMKTEHSDISATLSWPAFVAGGAALGPDLQNQISSWLLRSAQKTGFRMLSKAREALMQFWKERDNAQCEMSSWTDLLERQGCYLLLT